VTEATATATEETMALVARLAAALGGEVLGGIDPPAYGPQIGFGRDERPWGPGITPLLEYGLLKVHGADAATFLQAQLTNDVAGLVGDDTRLAGYCSVKGRLTTSAWIWRDEAQQTFWLACSRDIAAAFARRLTMFVLRAKVKVENVSDTVALVGTMHQAGASQPSPQAGPVRLPPVVIDAATAAAVGVGDEAGTSDRSGIAIERSMFMVPSVALAQTLADFRDAGAALLPTEAWRRLEVVSGVARINAASQDLFVPQMVNFELVNGVSFSKGCYPGQEIVARSQYLGKLKRRMFLAVGDGEVPSPGADVTSADSDAAEPVGQVVLAAPLPGHRRFILLFESKTAAVPGEIANVAQTSLRVGGSLLERLRLPYAIPASDKPDGR